MATFVPTRLFVTQVIKKLENRRIVNALVMYAVPAKTNFAY